MTTSHSTYPQGADNQEARCATFFPRGVAPQLPSRQVVICAIQPIYSLVCQTVTKMSIKSLTWLDCHFFRYDCLMIKSLPISHHLHLLSYWFISSTWDG